MQRLKISSKISCVLLALAMTAPQVDAQESDCWSGDFEAGARKTITYNGVEFAFHYCPVGTLVKDNSKDETPIDYCPVVKDNSKVETPIDEGFWICETETTLEQWNAVGIEKKEKCDYDGAKQPVTKVTWADAEAFIKKLNESGVTPEGWILALPTADQWEYACRAGTTGDTYGVPLEECAWYRDDEENRKNHINYGAIKPREVAQKKPNAWGLYDMLGNVFEMTSSQWPAEVSQFSGIGSSPIGCGGSCFDPPKNCRPSCRLTFNRTYPHFAALGFRMALVPNKAE